MSGAGITIVSASAGSGKTFRLTREVTSSISARGPERVDLAGLVAVTFTKKAHTELEARIRHKLVQEEAYDEALRLPLAYLGTVHAAALRLLQEFALDAGLSPHVDVIAGNETKLLRQALERTLDEPMRARLDRLARSLELRIDGRTSRTDWITPVAQIMDLARSNRIPPGELPAMATRSVERLISLLPPPVADGATLDAALARELERALAALRGVEDGIKKTSAALDSIAKAKTRLADGELRWSDWERLSRVEPAKKCERYVQDLREVAGRYLEHPRLHGDLSETTRAIFDAARAGLVAYQDWKRERRVVDYVDMLDGALDLVEHPRVQAELSRRLQLVVVDEFQDTSPIQLALFVRLHALAGRSVWVGDRKQCIFEYAGADPVLMDAVAEWVERAGGGRDRLRDNYRSRPELVDACSELFAAALAKHGFAREEVVVAAKRPEEAALAALPPIGLWALESKSSEADAEAVAEGVRRTLDAPHETPVLDRTTKAVRAVRPGDIAVLVRTNEAAGRLAHALHARGIRAALARAGLFDTPEGTLADAALRWLLDPDDTLAAAVIDALTGWGGRDADAWLVERIGEAARRGESAGAEAAASDGGAAPEGWRLALDALRSRLEVLSPAEVLDATLAAMDAVLLCARWPDPAQRVANLDAVRGAAADYEARAAQEREAATVAGMLRYFASLRTPTLQKDEILPSDDQHVPADDGAVVVCTYHKSKGLEWPVVVLTALDSPERRGAFEVAPESLSERFDPERPLANRAIRYWPWPLGAAKKSPLASMAEESEEGRAVALREEKERARLLYVGCTRARDHLVLAARVSLKGAASTRWLDSLSDADGNALVELPVGGADGAIAETRIRRLDGVSLAVRTRVLRLAAERSERDVEDARSPTWFERPAGAAGATSEAAAARSHPPYRIAPSEGSAMTDWPELAARVARSRVGAVERLASAVVLDGASYDYGILGDTVHAFLAADLEGLSAEERTARARRLIEGAAMTGTLRTQSLITAGDALRAWVARRWPAALWRREIPVDGLVESEYGERRVSGIIDLLLETEDGYVLIDHKTFPARAESAWRAKCAGFISQLAAYALVLDRVGHKRVEACWVHLPIGGGMVEVLLGGGERAL